MSLPVQRLLWLIRLKSEKIKSIAALKSQKCCLRLKIFSKKSITYDKDTC